MPATAGGSTSGSSISVTTRSRDRDVRVATQYAVGVPKRMISSHRDGVRLGRDDERVLGGARAERGDQVARRDAEEDRRDRQQQEQQGDARREDERRPEHLVYDDALGSGRKPAFFSAACPLSERIPLIHACAAALLPDFGHDRDLVAHARLRPGRDPDHGHLVAHRARVGDVDEAGVGLAERDLARHRLDVGLLADDLRRAPR